MNRSMSVEHDTGHRLIGVLKGHGVTQRNEARLEESQDDVIESIEIIRDEEGYVTQTIKRNAAGEVIDVIDADDDLIAGTGMR